MDDQPGGERTITRRRSSSTSGSDRLCSTLGENGLPIGNPGESNIHGGHRAVSDPNLLLNQGSYNDSPWGLGNTTVLSQRNKDADGIRTQILNDFNALKRKTLIWESQIEKQEISAAERDRVYDRMMEEVTRVSAEALCNSVDRFTYSEIRNLKTRLERSRRTAARDDLRSLKQTRPILQSMDTDPEEVFEEARGSVAIDEDEEDDINDAAQLSQRTERLDTGKDNTNQQQSIGNNEVDRIISNIISLQDDPIYGFAPGTDSSEVSDLKKEITVQNKTINGRLDKLEFTVLANSVRIGRAESQLKKTVVEVGQLKKQINKTVSGLSNIEEKVNSLNKWIGTIGTRLDQLDRDIANGRIGIDIPAISEEITKKITGLLIEDIGDQALHEIKHKIKKLTEDVKIDQSMTEGLREIVVGLKEQISIISTSHQSTITATNASTIPRNINLQEMMNSARECTIIKNSIERAAGLIRQLIATDITVSNIEVSLIKKCKLEDAPVVQKSIAATDAALVKYVRFPDMNLEFYNEVSNLLQTAGGWCLSVEAMYAKKEVHAINNSKGDTSSVGIFRDNFEQIIYEFIDELETCFSSWGTNKQRGNRLHTNHLSGPLKTKLIGLSDDFVKMKEYLIAEYGRSDRIVNDMLAGLMRKKKPIVTNRKERLTYFSDIISALQRIEKLRVGEVIDTKRLDECLYSRGTLSTLMSLLPDGDFEDFTRMLTKEKLDWNNPSGVKTFDVFREMCEIERNAMESARNQELVPGAKVKAKGSHGVQRKDKDKLESSSEEEVDAKVHNVQAPSQGPPKQWFQSGMKFPCPLAGHKHEIAKCTEMLSMTPDDRWIKIERRKICYTCLQPKAICTGRRCISQQNVPEILVCNGCAVDAVAKGWAPLSILLCRKKEHSQLRAPWPEIKEKMEGYFGKFGSSIVEKNIKISANFLFQSYAANPERQNKDGKQDDRTGKYGKKLKIAPTIDSSTGRRIDHGVETIIPEVREQSFYLMQELLIGNSECLAFFDGGSNTHLMEGKLAIREGLQVISEKPNIISVVGGSQITTNFGTYRFNLGPGDNGEFHELVCLGMEKVSGRFEEYNLEEICEEYKENGGTETELPKKVGGSRVQLLIGIKNTNLTPVLLEILPSGVGVFRSPFKDKYGSRIIFAGPHPAFTKGSRTLENEVAIAVFSIREQRELMESVADNPELLIENYEYMHPRERMKEDHDPPVEIREVINDNLTGTLRELELAVLEEGQVHFCAVFKATVPIARMRELVDQDDIGDFVTFRCPECSKCMKCKVSRRRTAVSLQESMEQEIIEKSVRLDPENKNVKVNLPFSKDPTEDLSKRHKGNDNKGQAMHVYKTQCKKSEIIKDGIRNVHKELVERGFMSKLDDINQEKQKIIAEAPFVHYYPWRVVYKEDSLSTPVRLVVDPTMSGLNLLLAKGENRLGSIMDILIRTISQPFSWTSDISKLYNQLHLENNALPYSLFLYDESLDETVQPQVWVMNVAWYGVTSTGAQAGEALVRIAELRGEQYPEAAKCIKHDRYVDDLSPGGQTRKETNMQSNQTKEMLSEFGLDLKFIQHSGEEACEKASMDGKSIKLLGYKWTTKEDIIQLGFGELNLNKRVRGARKPNELPVVTRGDAENLLRSITITRRVAVSKVAELYDPLGWCEIIKIQFKLELTKLNEFDWDVELPQEKQELWKNLLAWYTELDKIEFRRCSIPDDKDSVSGIRLICLSDAAEHAGGAVVYGGRKLRDGSWSCSLITAKSKLMKSTIPRNELSAIMLMTELAFIVKTSLGERVSEVVYITDSTIAMSWCHNTNIKIRLFVKNRVETIRRMIEWAGDEDEIPLYHIDGLMNVADVLTKKHEMSVEKVTIGSVWQNGLPWMRLDTEQMPVLRYIDLTVTKDQEEEVKSECFEEPFLPMEAEKNLHTCCKVMITPPGIPQQIGATHTREDNIKGIEVPGPTRRREDDELIVKVVSLGWRRALRVLNCVLAFIQKIKHRKHVIAVEDCVICSKGEKIWEKRHMEQESIKVLCRYETRMIRTIWKPAQVSKYEEKEGILYFSGRLTKEAPFRTEDLDNIGFLDIHEFVGDIPVIRADSPILYAYIMDIHLRVAAHAGVERHVKEVFKRFMVKGPLRALIEKIISRCSKCRLKEKKKAELKLSNHPSCRTVLAPPFYNVMIDVAYGFAGQAYKRARKSMKIYALIIVCTMSGATNILALEGIETQDVVLALERHAARYGIPADIYIDQGTQLVALQNATFNYRDVDARIYDSMGARIHISNAKAHTERGRVERKIGIVRSMLERTGVKTTNPKTALQWETVFCKMASTLDDLPLAKGNTSNVTAVGFEIITPNRLKLGRNNNRSLEGAGITVDLNPNFTRILDRNRAVYQDWLQMFIDNIHFLTLKPDIWRNSSRLPIIDDIVLFVHNDSGQGKESVSWKLGKVVDVKDRKLSISFLGGEGNGKNRRLHTLERSIRDVSIIFSADEYMINTVDHFKEVCKT